MTHPLTYEMMQKIHGDRPGYSHPFDEDDMRAAYDKGRDDQLGQVIKWLKDGGYETDLLLDLKAAMRPQ